MISIVIATYNSYPVLPNCIESLKRSSYKDIELILVDNNSTDNTWDWIENNITDDFFCKSEKSKLDTNKGYAYACNRGVELASGEVILLLNPDTEVSFDAIGICQERLLSSPIFGAVGCHLVMPNGKLDLACRRSLPTVWNGMTRLMYLSKLFPKSKIFSRYNLTYLDERESYFVECLTGAFMMMRRNLYHELKGLDETFFMYGEDIDLCKRILDAGYKIWYEGSTITLHIKGGNGGKRSKRSIENFYGAMEIYFNKHFKNKYSVIVWYSVIVGIRLLRTLHILMWQFRSKYN